MCQKRSWSDRDECGCNDELDVKNLCAQKAKIKCLKADEIDAHHICAPLIEGGKSRSLELETNKICAQEGTIKNLCVDNLSVGSMNRIEKWRAAVTLSNNTIYNLGSVLNWNTILDDPNNNVALAPFSYTAAATGYYILSYYIQSDSLTGSGVIAGIPVGLLTVMANGQELRAFQSPYLSFSSLQKANLSAIVLLNAGDVITMKYDVLVFDQITGFIPYVGTVSIKGNGTFPEQSGFEIHFLSALVQGGAISCPECPIVEVGCMPNEPRYEPRMIKVADNANAQIASLKSKSSSLFKKVIR